jgi:DNA ligase-4
MKPWDGTFKVKPTVPIERVESLLVQLASKCRFSDPATQRKRLEDFEIDTELKKILGKLASWEAKWLVRLILRDHSTLDLDEHFILAKFHFLLPDLLLFQNDFSAALSMLRGELSCYPAIPESSKESSMRIEAAKRLKARVGIKVGRPTFYKAWSFNNCFQMTSNRAWAAEVKYDGEYCEIHINLEEDALNEIQIFSKNGKDATADRQALHQPIREALRIGRPSCMIKRNCIVLGELVLYSDKEDDILPFAKIRKHISRSGSFIGTMEDSLPHDWEHLMIVFFDVLVLDDEPIMRSGLQRRRDILRQLVRKIPGRAMRSEWTLTDFKTEDGILDLKQKFAESLARRQEGLILKPLHAPYFPLVSKIGHRNPGYFIKMKKDYLGDMGGERDLGDFAIIGARFDAQVAPTSVVKPLHWTHFYFGCLVNHADVQKSGFKPIFKVVGCVSVDKCISKQDAKWLNENGRLYEIDMQEMDAFGDFSIKRSNGYGLPMTVAFRKPFIVEVLGGGYDQVQNESFEVLRHPRVKKIHHDRTWEDAVTMEDLQWMAAEKWEIPAADKLDGHARDVAVLVRKYRERMSQRREERSQESATQETSQRTSPRTTQETPASNEQSIPDDAVVQETQQETWTTTSTTEYSSSTQGIGVKASWQVRVLVRQDTVERIGKCPLPQPLMSVAALPTPPKSSSEGPSGTSEKPRIDGIVVSPPPSKRRKLRSPLKDADNKRNLGAFDNDSQEKTIHIYAEAGWKVQVHTS